MDTFAYHQKIKMRIAKELQCGTLVFQMARIFDFAYAYDEGGKVVCGSVIVDSEAEFDKPASLEEFRKAGTCPKFPELWPEISALLEGSLLIAHNTAFDVTILKKTLAFYQLPIPKFDVACTLRLSRKYVPGLENYKLATVCNHFNIPVDMDSPISHSIACYEILRKLAANDATVFEEAAEFSL